MAVICDFWVCVFLAACEQFHEILVVIVEGTVLGQILMVQFEPLVDLSRVGDIEYQEDEADYGHKGVEYLFA